MPVEKTAITALLGKEALLRPSAIHAALDANARLKFALTWLQAAEELAARPDATPPDLSAERVAAGLHSDPLYDPPMEASSASAGVRLSRAAEILNRMDTDLACMLAAIDPASPAGSDHGALEARYRRLQPMLRSVPEVLPRGFVASLARARRDGPDSLHLLVMDLHKALNRVQAAMAEECLDGAQCHGLLETDRALVSAFMLGLNRTAPLKFDHPGLATNCMRSGDQLVIQNDIGTTDAHVLVIEITASRIRVDYTDIHARRLGFLVSRLKAFDWTRTRRDDPGFEAPFIHAVGTLEATAITDRLTALEQLGANLVFLIDWNKARKRLNRLLSEDGTMRLLRWAADNSVGHRAFLQCGGLDLIDSASEIATRITRIPLTGLRRALGEDAAEEYLRTVLSLCHNGLTSGATQDQITSRAGWELVAQLAGRAGLPLSLANDHAALVVDLADRLARIARLDDTRAASAALAKRCEAAADRRVAELREYAASDERSRPWLRIIGDADDAADEIEEAAFRLTLVREMPPPELHRLLIDLCRRAGQAARDWVRLLCQLREVHPAADAAAIRSLLDLTEKLVVHERESDAELRGLMTALSAMSMSSAGLHSLTSAAEAVERCMDALKHAALRVQDHALERRIAS